MSGVGAWEMGREIYGMRAGQVLPHNPRVWKLIIGIGC